MLTWSPRSRKMYILAAGCVTALAAHLACSSEEAGGSAADGRPPADADDTQAVSGNRPGPASAINAAGGGGGAGAGVAGGTNATTEESQSAELGLAGAESSAAPTGSTPAAPEAAGTQEVAPVEPEQPAPAPAALDTIADGSMSFFVTSRSPGNGGNLGGLMGADAFCRQLAVAASPDLGRRTWHAYLSTSSENARDRIGTGPWHNQAGDVIATSLEQLHDQAAGGGLDATWPVNDFSVPLDEEGNQLAQNVHDILTGSEQDGRLAAGLTCNDWTSAATTSQARNGHTNRAGLAGQPPSWNAVHTVGCGPAAANFAQGTVTSGGGRGSLYCFAVITGD
jgi:hypothetical protein